MPFLHRTARENETHWRKEVRALACRPGVLVDLGGGGPFQGYISASDLGPGTFYVCLDIAAVAHPHVVGDALALPLATGSVNSIFCNAVLEHVSDPSQAVDEMYRVLGRTGKVLVAVPFIYPYHDRVDYYRFTDTALQHVFRAFDSVEILPVGDYFFALLMFLTGFHYKTANRMDRLLGGMRAGFRLGLEVYEAVKGQRGTRDYRRALVRSPVGWHVYAEKR